MAHALIALGGNLGDVAQNFHRALVHLRACGIHVKACSALYGSVAWPDPRAPTYTNAAVLVSSHRGPYALLRLLKRIERRLGRTACRQRFASRTIDLDLLAHGRKKMMTQRLTLPHPRLHLRAFVILPLRDLGAEALGLGVEKELRRSFADSSKCVDKSILWRKCDEVFNAVAWQTFFQRKQVASSHLAR